MAHTHQPAQRTPSLTRPHRSPNRPGISHDSEEITGASVPDDVPAFTDLFSQRATPHTHITADGRSSFDPNGSVPPSSSLYAPGAREPYFIQSKLQSDLIHNTPRFTPLKWKFLLDILELIRLGVLSSDISKYNRPTLYGRHTLHPSRSSIINNFGGHFARYGEARDYSRIYTLSPRRSILHSDAPLCQRRGRNQCHP